ncbi:uncharacterized protein K441DRAFT_263235 [Cenococcum geophilum 1.58]|uniref:uncharacterized protein n=1 Tax=Cenococcum geophilum 1.58 TaxID=794803 RepID=UPI00358F35A9|nr:hypothetical protein K441DRAFT_263235 [Cenococcum geophilum 1.58]
MRTSGVHAYARKHGRVIKDHASRDKARNPNGTRISCRPPRLSPTSRKPRAITTSPHARWRRALPPSASWSTAPMAATCARCTTSTIPWSVSLAGVAFRQCCRGCWRWRAGCGNRAQPRWRRRVCIWYGGWKKRWERRGRRSA